MKILIKAEKLDLKLLKYGKMGKNIAKSYIKSDIRKFSLLFPLENSVNCFYLRRKQLKYTNFNRMYGKYRDLKHLRRVKFRISSI